MTLGSQRQAHLPERGSIMRKFAWTLIALCGFTVPATAHDHHNDAPRNGVSPYSEEQNFREDNSTSGVNGPNRRRSDSSNYGNAMPQFRPTDDRPRYSPFDRRSRTVDCGCAICDPNTPCSSGNCQSQNCTEFGQGHVSGRSDGFPSNPPARIQPTWNDRPLRYTPRPQAPVQKLCPVTGDELDSMGSPIAVNVLGKRIYVCCDSCVTAVRRSPQKYLQKVADDLAAISPTSFRTSRTLRDPLW
jgi:hypothetical protein